jgi:hypothetical protein
MAHDPGPAEAGDSKVAQVLNADEHGLQGGNNVSTSAPPIQDYDVERVEKVYRLVFSLLSSLSPSPPRSPLLV